MDPKQGTALIGTSGWKYPPWRGTFYPSGLVQRLELNYISQKMTSLEINGPFYGLMRPSTYASWQAQIPKSFPLAIKGWKDITHERRLKNAQPALTEFFNSGVLTLGDNLGPILWQLPPNLTFDANVLDAFFAVLPKSTPAGKPIRYAMEPRHVSFASADAVSVFRAHNVALVTSDNPGKWPVFHEITASFAYLRLHGSTALYASSYTNAGIDSWAKRISTITGSGLDVYCFFDNTADGHAPLNAQSLMLQLSR